MKARLNDSDRSQWIDNDEGLYDWWRKSQQSKRAFIRDNRAEIDSLINGLLDPKPATVSYREPKTGVYDPNRPLF